MKVWKKLVVKPKTTLRETIKTIDAGQLQIALVVDDAFRLLGTITDGDIRRAILRGITLEDTADKVMNSDPFAAGVDDDRDAILKEMRIREFRQVPLLDDQGKLVGIEVLEELSSGTTSGDNWVVLMAGGLGSRLGELTKETPKPLLKVGANPLLQTTLEKLTEYGFKKFFISVNYRAEQIMDHFGDGSKWKVQIEYLRENEALGTAGSLSLLPQDAKAPKHPILVLNGDVLTKVNFQQLLDFHAENQADATMCVRQYDLQIPYGIVDIDKSMGVTKLMEKPSQRFFINAGIYVLNPSVLGLIPKGKRQDMTEVFQTLIDRKMRPCAFPVREYWIDVGRADDLQRAKGEYSEEFK